MRYRIRFRTCSKLGSNSTDVLILALMTAFLIPTLLWVRISHAADSARDAKASVESKFLFPRSYYLTNGVYNGASADGADGNGAGVCNPGYHFASLWEILDPSNLRYNSDLGVTFADSGKGPPSFSTFGGWVRTGYESNASTTPGMGNCSNWSSSASSDWGTFVRLPNDWSTAPDLGVWKVQTISCDTSVVNVWCVADRAGLAIYLPMVFK